MFFKSKGIVTLALLLMVSVSLVGCWGGDNTNKSVLNDIKVMIEESKTTDEHDTIDGDPISYDYVILRVKTESSLRIISSVTNKIFESTTKDDDRQVDGPYHRIYFGKYLIIYQGNAALYKIEEDGTETLIKRAYQVSEAIADEVHELIDNIKSQENP